MFFFSANGRPPFCTVYCASNASVPTAVAVHSLLSTVQACDCVTEMPSADAANLPGKWLLRLCDETWSHGELELDLVFQRNQYIIQPIESILVSVDPRAQVSDVLGPRRWALGLDLIIKLPTHPNQMVGNHPMGAELPHDLIQWRKASPWL